MPRQIMKSEEVTILIKQNPSTYVVDRLSPRTNREEFGGLL